MSAKVMHCDVFHPCMQGGRFMHGRDAPPSTRSHIEAVLLLRTLLLTIKKHAGAALPRRPHKHTGLCYPHMPPPTTCL